MSRNRLAALIVVVSALLLGTGAVAGGATGARIVARPNSVMVNTKTSLTGSGFPARTKLSIRECSKTNWVVPTHPCVKGNGIKVVTDAHGRFTHAFEVRLCGGKRGPGPTSQVCYIGAERPEGVDTVHLVGAARVVVTYP
jgi:hypothetical protein